MKDQFLELNSVNLKPVDKPLKVLLLGDDEHPANTVIDYIQSFVKHSSHDIKLINPINSGCPKNLSTKEFDAIIIHYSICITEPYFLSANWVKGIAHFNGVKAQIIQDEYRWINKMKTQMRCLGIQTIFSSLTPKNAAQVYNGDFMSDAKVISCLPGYFSERLLSLPYRPLQQREYDVIYRGRDLPWSTGELGASKRRIGQNFIAWNESHELRTDIETRESSRIYGDDWDRFLMNGKSMIGVEGGASIFDFDGTLKDSLDLFESENPESDLSKYWEEHLKPIDGNLVHRTITPKIFEAIAARTALILVPGEYRGILEPNRHYIPFMEDGSNFNEIVRKIKDYDFLEDIVERTFNEITSRDELTYKFFINKFDQILSFLEKNPVEENVEKYFREKVTIQNLQLEIASKQIMNLNEDIKLLGHQLKSVSQREEMLKNQRTQSKNERTQLENERTQLENERTQLETLLKNERTKSKNLQQQIQLLRNPLRLGLFWISMAGTKIIKKLRLLTRPR